MNGSDVSSERGFYDGLASLTASLYELGQIQEGSYAHKSRKGHFINTGGGWAAYGVQRIATYWKGHSEDKLANDIDDLVQKLLIRIGEDITLVRVRQGDDNQLTVKAEFIMEMRILAERMGQAINGIEKNGGLRGLIKTYEGNEAFVQKIGRMIKDLEAHCQLGLEVAEECQAILAESQPEEKAVMGEAEKFYKMLEEENQLIRAESVGILKYEFNYTGGLYFNVINNALYNYDWSNKIGHFEKGDLILGALPIWTLRYDSLAEMKEQEVGAVLSITEAFENRSSGTWMIPITPQQFLSANINQMQLLSPDFETISLGNIERGVQYIHDHLVKDTNVYVHCKAGRGRSALVIMCYLIKHQGMSATEAFDCVKVKRPQAGFTQTDPKYQTLLDYEAKCRQST